MRSYDNASTFTRIVWEDGEEVLPPNEQDEEEDWDEEDDLIEVDWKTEPCPRLCV